MRHEDSLKNRCAPAETESPPPKRMRHVGLALFARVLCRKFADEATISWHLPQRKMQNRGSTKTSGSRHAAGTEILSRHSGNRTRNDGDEEERKMSGYLRQLPRAAISSHQDI